jgi:hypothetical protein
MLNKYILLVIIIATIVIMTLSLGGCKTKNEKLLAPNEPILTNIYIADPSAHVFNDILYIYPSHDPNYEEYQSETHEGGQYMMDDYHVISMIDFDTPATDHGIALHLDDIPWASMQLWAPDAAYRDGKYYLYFPAKDQDGIFRIGVATSDIPEGPFIPETDYMPGTYSIDPAVFIDGETAYMLLGGLWGGQLERWQSGSYEANRTEPNDNEPALGPMIAPLSKDMLTIAAELKVISILDKSGDPILAGDEERRFFEAAWIHKYNGRYYLSYSTGSTHYIVYATSDSIEGPYTYQGKILNPVEGWTSHHSIVEYKDTWYLFYHDASLSNGVDQQRSVKYVELEYKKDGSIITINP